MPDNGKTLAKISLNQIFAEGQNALFGARQKNI